MSYFYKAIIGLFFMSSAFAAEEKLHKIEVKVILTCPESEELTRWIESVPPEGYSSPTVEDWKKTLFRSMEPLMELVASGKMQKSFWSADIEEVEAE